MRSKGVSGKMADELAMVGGERVSRCHQLGSESCENVTTVSQGVWDKFGQLSGLCQDIGIEG